MAITEQVRVWKDSKMKGEALLVLLAIADSANEWGYGFPGRERLKTYGRLSDEATVTRIIKKLQEAGEIGVARCKGKVNHYTVLVGLSADEVIERIKRLTETVPTHQVTPDLKSLLEKQSSDPTITSTPDPTVTTTNDPVVPKSSVEPSVDPSIDPIPAVAAVNGNGKSKAKLDVKGRPLNNKHPEWEGIWNAVLSVKGWDAGKLPDIVRKNIANVVSEIIKPCVYEPADVLYFKTFAKDWNNWSVNAIATRIADARSARLNELGDNGYDPLSMKK